MSNLETSGYTGSVAPRPSEVYQSQIFNQLDRKGTSREEKKCGGGGKTFQDQELTEEGFQDEAEAAVKTFAPSVRLDYKDPLWTSETSSTADIPSRRVQTSKTSSAANIPSQRAQAASHKRSAGVFPPLFPKPMSDLDLEKGMPLKECKFSTDFSCRNNSRPVTEAWEAGPDTHLPSNMVRLHQSNGIHNLREGIGRRGMEENVRGVVSDSIEGPCELLSHQQIRAAIRAKLGISHRSSSPDEHSTSGKPPHTPYFDV
jgi:hypothetical protein